MARDYVSVVQQDKALLDIVMKAALPLLPLRIGITQQR